MIVTVSAKELSLLTAVSTVALLLVCTCVSEVGSTTCSSSCSAGEYLVVVNSTALCGECPSGFYCEGNLSAPQACPRGSANQLIGQINSSACLVCIPGTYGSQAGLTSCLPCPDGSACPNASIVSPIPCESGFYAVSSGDVGATDCTECPLGTYCPFTFSVPIPCASGFYSNETMSINCTQCPGGHHCPDPSLSPQPCSPGSYAPPGSTACLQCPPGTACSQVAMETPQTCSLGQYSFNSTSGCSFCPVGYFCPDPNLSPIVCPSGMYSNVTGQTSCVECEQGRQCLDGTESLPCPAGTFSLALQADCTQCDIGMYSLEGSGECIECPEGQYCSSPASTPLPCQAGHVSMGGQNNCTLCDTGLIPDASQSTCVNCPAGHYCSDPRQSPLLCPNGTYSLSGANIECTPCPQGYSCPLQDSVPQLCSVETYSPLGSSECLLCPAGSSCLNESLPQPCVPGEYSLLGDPLCSICPVGFYCQTTSELPSPCPSGTYSNESSITCTPCPPGSYCSSPITLPLPCPTGTYSVENTTTCQSCLAGFACLGTDVEPVPCDPGYYGGAGDVMCTICPPGFKCPLTDRPPEPCPPGYVSDGGSTNCTACPSGHACPDVDSSLTISPCSPGTYSAGMQQTCTSCPGGMYCPHTFSATEFPCEPGSFSVGNQTSCTPCPPGMACTASDGSANIVCSPGTYSTGRSEVCVNCPPGFACPLTDQALTVACQPGTFSAGMQTVCTECPVGMECPFIDQASMTDCSPGHYSLGNQSSCTPCPPGYECLSRTTNTETPCESGYYSLGGSASCTMCNRGFACPSLTSPPLPCSPGTYSLDAAVNCSLCDAGHQCQDPTTLPVACELGTWSPPGSIACQSCNHGYQCLEASTTPTPSDQICLIGGWCDGIDRFLCPEGFYGNITGAGSQEEGCVICPPGYYCPNTGTTSFESNICPEGYFCPYGTTFAEEFPCPAGTFNNRTMQTSIETGCSLICPVTMYCPRGSTRGQTCPAGFYCPEGTPSAYHSPCPLGTYGPDPGFSEPTQCVECPVGHYCPSGNNTHPTVSPLPCQPGTYNPLNGTGHEFNCLLCTAGMSCPSTALTEPSHSCNEGHYCPNGTIFSNQYPCPPGTFTFSTALQSPEQCDICPAGRACGWGTGFNFSESLPCAQGHYCPLGTPATNRFPCPPGTFTEQCNLTSPAECSVCTAGHYCIGGGAGPTDVCPRGHYCPEGTRLPHQFPCPKTTYNSLFGQNSTESCLNCTVGHFCESGFIAPEACPAGTYMPFGFDTVSATTIGDPIGNKSDCLACPGGQFCVEGSVSPADCGLGVYSPSGSEFCFTCLVGHYCDENSTSEDNMRMNKQCPPGNFCAPGLSAVEESQLCTTGFYCPQGTCKELACPPGTYNPLEGQSALSHCLSCVAGYYCLENASLPTGPCQPGFYCPTDINNGQLSRNIGSYGPTQVPCPGGTYQENFTSAIVEDCVECPEGNFCIEGSANPAICTMGYYCTPGLTAPVPCPVGTIGSNTGLIDETECVACPPGQYCDSPSLTSPRGPCDPGFVCYLGANMSDPTDSVSGEVCPAGGYCPLGSSTSLPCPPGTFSNTSGSTNTFDCTECTPGFYCSNARTPEPTGPCNAGYYCPGGAKTPNDTVTLAGHFTPEGSAAPVPCNVGTWMPHSAAGECLPCSPGHYCPEHGSSTVTLCPIGHFCEEGAFDPAPCPPGTYSNQTGLSSLSECLSCPPGSFCASGGLTAPEGLCMAGFACYGNSSLPNPIESDEVTFGGLCSAGHYCPEGSGGGIPCPVGTFSSAIGLAADSGCTQCPVGMHCNTSGLTEPSGLCDLGYFCSGSAVISSPTDGATGDVCPLGHFCVSGSESPAPCLSGTYGNSTGLSVCLTCLPGHFCHPGSIVEPEICPAGFYCSPGTGLDYRACPIGTLGSREGLADESQCAPCSTGSYCDSTALTAPTGPCDPGYFCSSGATDPRPLETVSNGPCPAGFYCPQNSSSPTPCPPGTYSQSAFNTEEGDCLPCDPGRHCNVSGLTAVTGLCAEGYYCTNGSSTAFPFGSTTGDICPVAHFCPEGSSVPVPCSPGTYSNVTGNGACLPCLTGFYCEGSTDDPQLFSCTPGYYCPQGTQFAFQFPCPLSTFNPSESAVDSSACLPCLTGHYCNGTGLDSPSGTCNPGSYCDPGSISPTGQPCEPGFYCPPDASFQLPCPPGQYCGGFGLISPTGFCEAGYYCTGGASIPQPNDGITGDVCPMGHYCLGGSVNFTACPPGMFGRVTQARNESEGCEVCPATMYCGEHGLVSPSGVCDGGYYCPPGQRTSDPFEFVCPLGHFCVTGTLEPMRCPSGTYQDERARIDCKICPASFYCDNRFEPVVLFNDTICPEGYYCPNGTTFATEFPCPVGTFSNLTGLADSAQCLDCTPGHYCREPGLTQPTGQCFAGYFCPLGGISPSPADSACPAGHYCPVGSTDPIPCLAGTHSPTTLNRNETACTPCDPGHYCPEASVNSTALVCDAGFVCLFGAFVPNPIDNITGYPCPAGHFCVSGALSEETCSPGSYQPDAAQSDCVVCPVGAICNSIAALEFTPCPAGHYCPAEGMTDSIPCPTGTFSNTTGNTNLTDCLSCPRGVYCGSPRLVAPSGQCSAGYLCVSAATDVAPNDGVNTPCPAGFYCVEGATHPRPCPMGTLAPFSNALLNNDSSFLLEYFCDSNSTLDPLSAIRLESASECVPCIGGFYCQYLNSTLPTGPCSAGYYCPHNTSITVPTPSEFICPVGHFCTEASLSPTPCPLRTFSNTSGALDCTPCPPGHLCAVGTIEPQVCPPHSYCPAESSEPVFCPNGTYTDNDTLGLSAADQCAPCLPGRFCLAGDIAGECIAGYLCYQGSAVPNPNGSDTSIGELCPEGFYCLQGAVNATSCPLGLFNVLRGGRQVEDCTDCPPGRVCSGNVAALCSPGFYCTSGTPLPCPVGTYNLAEGASVLSDCLSCEPGYLCPNESTVTFLHTPCPVGHYCLGGSITPTPCPFGTHRNETTAANVSDCYPCPAQFYCPDTGTVHGTPCNITDVCLEGSVAPLPCPPGFYCPRTDLQLPCPPGYYCPESSAWFIRCPRDHYCTQPSCDDVFLFGAGSSAPEICPLGSREILNLGENFTRGSLDATCEPCPPGTYMNASALVEERICFTCPEGFYCSGGAIFGDQGLTPMLNAFVCPAGHYCEAGSPSPTACSAGSFNPSGRQSNSSVCQLCPLDSFNHLLGQRACFNCSSEASTLTEGSVECLCTGVNRRFQPSDGRCPCRAGFIQYEGRTDGDCQPIVYPLCGEDQIRSQSGTCRTLAEWEEFCMNSVCRSAELFVELDRSLGICVCTTQVLDDVCNPSCQQSNLNRFQIMCVDPPMAVITDNSGNTTLIELASIAGLFSTDLCGSLDGRSLQVFTVETAGNGFHGNYMPGASILVSILTASTTQQAVATNTTATRRRRQTVTDPVSQPLFGGIDDPLACLEVEQSLFFFLSNSSYPVYDEHNLLNANADFDLGLFSQLVEDQLLTGDNQFFAFRFTQSGLFSFYLSDTPSRYLYVRVVEPTSQCPETGPFYPASPSRAVQLGMVRSNDIVQDPNWVLIGGLLGGAVILMVAMVIALLLFRKYGWSKPVFHKPKYRRVNKRLNLDHYSSKGSTLLSRKKAHPVQDVALETTQGLLVTADDFWDYDNQVDLEAFSSKQLYTNLADQSHHVVSTIGGQKEQAKALFHKIQSEADSLKGLWVAKLNLQGRAELASPEKLRAYEALKEKYSNELERRKLLCQQFGDVLTTQLQLLERTEGERQSLRIHCDTLFMEVRSMLKWMRELKMKDDRITSDELVRLDTRVKSLIDELKTATESRCSQLGITGKHTGARLVSMETSEVLSLVQIQNALSSENDAVVVNDTSTGLARPGASARLSLPSGITQEITRNCFIDLTTGHVLPISGNIHYDPLSLKLVHIRAPPDVTPAKPEPLIPFIPYPVNAETGEPIETGLEVLETPSQLRLGGAMRDPITGLCVPICGVTIHPRTKSLLPVGGAYHDPVTGLLIPIEIGAIMIDAATLLPVPLLGVTFHPHTSKIVPIGGSGPLSDGEHKALLVGEEFIDPLSELPLKVSSAVFGYELGELVPTSGDHQIFLDCAEVSLQVQLADSLVILCDLTRTAREEQGSLLAEKFTEVEDVYSKLTRSRSNTLAHSLKLLHSLAQRLASCRRLAQTGGSPCLMEYGPTGQLLPLLLGYPIPDPSDHVMVPVLDYQVSPITGMGEPIAGTMETAEGGGRVPITVGERMYSEAVGGMVPVVGARRNVESGVVVPVPQDSAVFSLAWRRHVERETVQLLEEEVVSRMRYWSRSGQLLEKLTSGVDQISLSIQSTNLKQEDINQLMEDVSSSSKELTQMVLAEKQRYQLSKPHLLSGLPPEVSRLLTSVTDDELSTTESHASSHVRFTEVTDKLFARVLKEEQSFQARAQQAQEANNPEAERQLTRNHQQKMATLTGELRDQMLSQRQLLYQSEGSLGYIRSKAELSCQLAKSVLCGEVAMPSSDVGYSSGSDGGQGRGREYAQLMPLLEQLVQLVQRQGVEEIIDEREEDTEVFQERSQASVTTAPPQQLHIPSVSVEQATSPSHVKKDQVESPSVNSLGLPVMSPDMKSIAKQLIEKHTIENVNLENRLRESENAALKKLYAKIEERKSRVISDSKKEVEEALADAEPESKEHVMQEKTRELQQKLEEVEEEKSGMLETTLAQLVEERANEKEKLLKAHQDEAKTRNLSSSHLVDTAPPPSEDLLEELRQLAEQEEALRAELSLELARSEEERLKREESLRQMSMSRHIVESLKSLDCSDEDLEQQEEEMSKLDTALVEQQSVLKRKISMVINERRRSHRKSRTGGPSIQQKANNALVEVALSAIASNESLKAKKDFGREALISVGGSKPHFIEILTEYDEDVLSEEDKEKTVERKEAIAAMKLAQWRLKMEIKKDQQQKEQLKLSQSKQAHLSGFSDTLDSLPDVSTDTASLKQRKDELLEKQLQDQVEVELKHQKELSELEQTAHSEDSNTLAKHSDEKTEQIESSIKQREVEFQQQLASRQGQLSIEEGNRMIAEHQREMAALRETLEADQDQQTKVLTNKIAERKRKKAEKLAERQKLEVDKLLSEQTAAREELDLSQRRDAEKEMLNELLKDRDTDKIESIVFHVVKQRHFEETVQLAAQHEREKELAINEKKSEVKAAKQAERETLVDEQEKELIELIAHSTSLPNAELAKQKLELKKRHKKQLTEFDKSTQEAVEKVVRRVSPEKELHYNSQVLALRERQIKELAQVMSEYSPEQALVKSYEAQAERAATEAEAYRREVIESREKKIAKLKEERRQKEEARKKERESKLRELEAEIEREKQKDVQRQEQLNERYQLMQQQRIAQQEELHKSVLARNAGISDQERQRMLDEHKETMRKMLESMESEKQRQVNRLESEIKRRREKKERKCREQLEDEEAKAVQVDDEEEERRVEEVTEEEAQQLQTKLEQTSRPSTPVMSKPSAHPPLEEPVLPLQDVSSVTGDAELNRLLMATPLFSQLLEIERLLQPQLSSVRSPPPSDASVSTPYIDVRDAQWYCEGELVVAGVQSLQPVDFVVYRFGVFASNLLEKQVSTPKVTILLATSLPLNNYTHNCFRNSFFYEHSKKTLYVRKNRLETVGEFVLVILHCLAHVKCGELTDDRDPLFLREFYSAIGIVCQDLFFSRVNRPLSDSEMSVGAVVKSVSSWENRDQTVEDLINMKVPSVHPSRVEPKERGALDAEERIASGESLTGVVVPSSNWNSRSAKRPTHLALGIPKTE